MNNFGVVEIASERRSVAPGWAYVPDTAVAVGAASTQAAASSGGGGGAGQHHRKRAARHQNTSALANFSDLSARQETKIRRELELLDRDSGSGIGGGRDAAIALPAKAVKAQNKHTPNVRKILASQKTFANHLDDFKAFQEHSGGGHGHGHGAGDNFSHTTGGRAAAAAAAAAVSASSAAAGGAGSSASRDRTRGGNNNNSSNVKNTSSRRKDSRRSTAAAAARKSSPATKNNKSRSATAGVGDTPMPDAPPPETAATADGAKKNGQPASAAEAAAAATASAILQPYDGPRPPAHPLDADPLLTSRMPPLPSDDELRALLAAPPLTYTEARAVWPLNGSGAPGASAPEKRYPMRVFCEICGYWGRVKCTKCGTPVCALDCLEVHREDCITRYGL